ncbi:hypothetical protein PH5382_02799 [Phaeobacter sp. CECT 5382]|nr:hypothetical protein PH5382_02799 [Phaeobacter sp. CECT 5382]
MSESRKPTFRQRRNMISFCAAAGRFRALTESVESLPRALTAPTLSKLRQNSRCSAGRYAVFEAGRSGDWASVGPMANNAGLRHLRSNDVHATQACRFASTFRRAKNGCRDPVEGHSAARFDRAAEEEETDNQEHGTEPGDCHDLWPDHIKADGSQQNAFGEGEIVPRGQESGDVLQVPRLVFDRADTAGEDQSGFHGGFSYSGGEAGGEYRVWHPPPEICAIPPLYHSHKTPFRSGFCSQMRPRQNRLAGTG